MLSFRQKSLTLVLSCIVGSVVVSDIKHLWFCCHHLHLFCFFFCPSILLRASLTCLTLRLESQKTAAQQPNLWLVSGNRVEEPDAGDPPQRSGAASGEQPAGAGSLPQEPALAAGAAGQQDLRADGAAGHAGQDPGEQLEGTSPRRPPPPSPAGTQKPPACWHFRQRHVGQLEFSLIMSFSTRYRVCLHSTRCIYGTRVLRHVYKPAKRSVRARTMPSLWKNSPTTHDNSAIEFGFLICFPSVSLNVILLDGNLFLFLFPLQPQS